MTLNLTVVQPTHTDFTPRITVIGVGGGGTNAVDNMIAGNLQGVEFIVANTDAQQLMHSRADRRIQLGPHITQGLGAGAKPEIGRAAAEEAADELMRQLDGAHMLFITAGMGGGTGTGAAPVIARMAKERGILTVGVVTRPFDFEGKRRQRAAETGIEELQHYVDTLIVIPNQNLFRMATERTTWRDAFKMADQVLYMGVRGVTDLMMAPGLVNLDFADIRTVMAAMGKAMMGTGEAEGDNRAIRAAEAAINNPLLEDTSMSGARGLLINITGGDDLTLYEVDQAANRIREEVDDEAEIIFGSAIDESLQGKIRVSVVATGIDTQPGQQVQPPRLKVVGGEDHMLIPPMQREGGYLPAGAAQAGYGQAGYTQTGHIQAGFTPTTAPVAQLRSTASEQFAAEPMDPGASGDPALMQDPLMGHDAAPQRVEPTLAPMAEHAAPRQPAAPSLGTTAPLAAPSSATQSASSHSLNAPPRTARGQPSGLFAPAQPAAPASRAPTSHVPSTEVARSLFGRVTGVFGFRQAAEPDIHPSPAAPVAHEPPAGEQMRPTVRQTTAEDIGIGIPKFLLRQTSGAAAPPRR
ncbi:MAG TPA: cell division protein FtsZ [Acetobacteraceae bacterium]|jgi:cell division protein FtsZ|nr:cell division protein FtsZ [Acetobacteraceae bacterium]